MIFLAGSCAPTRAENFIEKISDEAFFRLFIEQKKKLLPSDAERNILFPLIKSPFYSLCLKMEQHDDPNALPHLRKQWRG